MSQAGQDWSGDSRAAQCLKNASKRRLSVWAESAVARRIQAAMDVSGASGISLPIAICSADRSTGMLTAWSATSGRESCIPRTSLETKLHNTHLVRQTGHFHRIRRDRVTRYSSVAGVERFLPTLARTQTHPRRQLRPVATPADGPAQSRLRRLPDCLAHGRASRCPVVAAGAPSEHAETTADRRQGSWYG